MSVSKKEVYSLLNLVNIKKVISTINENIHSYGQNEY